MPFNKSMVDPASNIRELLRGRENPLPAVSAPPFDQSMMDQPKPMSMMSDELPSIEDMNREVSPFGEVSLTDAERKQAYQAKLRRRQDINRQRMNTGSSFGYPVSID
jgi:hypothetical protein